MILLFLVGCTVDSRPNEKLQVVSSYGIITDMLYQIGQDKIEIHNLVPSGKDPHEYEPLPLDIKKASDADLLFYDGLNLENGWFFKLANSVNQEESALVNLSEGIKPLYLSDEMHEGNINPHAYLDVNNGMIMVENIYRKLSDKDPINKSFYESNYHQYLSRLQEIDLKYRNEFNSLHDSDKVIVTSERAFQYMNHRYGLKEAYIWSVDTEGTGTVSQIKRLSEFIKKENVSILFIESNVDPRPMQTVSIETGVPIFEKVVYSDEIGTKDSQVDTYEKMLEHNLSVFIEGVKENGEY